MANKQRKREIEHLILELLEAKKNNYLSLKEITEQLEIRKHEHKVLHDILNQLKRDKRISVRNKQFGIKASTPSKTLIGKFDATSLVKGYSYAFVKHPDGDIFIDSEDTSNAFHNDEVAVRIKYKRRNLLYGVVERVEKRANNTLSGNLELIRNRHYFIPDLGKIDAIFEVSDLSGAVIDDKVVFKVVDWGDYTTNRKPSGKVIEILGKAGDNKTEVLALIKQFDLPLEFPLEVMKEVEKIAEDITSEEISRRDDYRDLFTVTIDPESAKDYDDAISLVEKNGNYELYVHIADVSHYVQPESKLFAEALERGNSFYFPKRVIPMLPEKLSNKVCSLRPEEEKLTLTVKTVFDHSLKIIQQSVSESVICSSVRLNYEEVDDYYAGQKTDFEELLATMLDKLRDVSRELSRRRYAKGYIPFNMPETEFIYDDEGKITELKRSEETESHKIVENCMLLANEYVAQKLHKKLGKGIYRVHEEPDTSSLEKILKLLAYYRIKYKKNLRGQKLVQNVLRAMPTETYHKVFDPLILRSMKKARYDIEPLGHFGLASQNYTHFTSPIRRISDLAVHRLLRENFWRKSVKPQLDEKTLKKIADKASEREQLADTAEREVSYQFKKIFMKDKVGEEFEGIIVNLTNNNIMVELDEFPVTGIIPINTLQGDKFSFYQLYMELTGKRSNRIFRLMDRLRVRVERIDYDLIFSLNEKVSD